MNFSAQELVRYRRHLTLGGFGPAAQARLKASSVLVVGAGGLGCPALLYLAAVGVGRIVVVDADCVELTNLQRQVLYTEADVGEPKAEVAAERLRALNALITVEARAERLARDNALDLVRSCDVVIDGSDNFPTRYLVNDACVLVDRPFVYGAIQRFEGQLSVFNWRGGPTYRCLFPQPPAPGIVPDCAEAGVLGVMPGLIGTAQACEAIKLLTGIGEPLTRRLLLWDVLTMTVRSVPLAMERRAEIRELPAEDCGRTCNAGLAPIATVEEIDANALRAALASTEGVQLVDVREEGERALAWIEPSFHVALSALKRDGGAALAGLDPAARTVVYCAAGVRSRQASRLLREQYGFETVMSLQGGMQGWNSSGGSRS